MPRKHKKRKKTQQQRAHNVDDANQAREPRTMVIQRGRFALAVRSLKQDLRDTLQPNTAGNLKDRRTNQLRDFVDACIPLGVSHLLILSATEQGLYLKIAKIPQGPTITYHILKYSCMHDIRVAQSAVRFSREMLRSAPLVVLTNFGDSEQHKLTTTMFQNLFPPINLRTINLSACKRVLLLDYDDEHDFIHLRHYSIRLPISGVRQNIRTLLEHKKAPDMGRMVDVSDLITKSAYGSESEAEDAADARVTLADHATHTSRKQQRRVKLHEIGPRLKLQIIKVEENVASGRVLYHKYVKKSLEEVAEMDKLHEDREQLRKMRRKQQEANIERKQNAKKQRRQRVTIPNTANDQELESDDDWQHYIDEVGEEPDEHFNIVHNASKKRKPMKSEQKVPGNRMKTKRKQNFNSSRTRSKPESNVQQSYKRLKKNRKGAQ